MPLEDVRRDVLGHAFALVGDVDEDRVTAVGPAHTHRGRPGPVAQGVLDDGGQHLSQGPGRGQHRVADLIGEGDGAPGLLEGRLPLLALLSEDVLEVKRLRGPAPGAARDLEQVLDDAGEPLDLLQAGVGLGTHLLLAGEQLDLLQAQRQAGQRCAQLVGGIGGELPLSGDASSHTLGRTHQLSLDQVDLLDPRGAQPRADLAAAELLGLGGQVDERGRDAPGHPGGHHGGRRERGTGEYQNREDDRADDDDPVAASGGAQRADDPGAPQRQSQQEDRHRHRRHRHRHGVTTHGKPSFSPDQLIEAPWEPSTPPGRSSRSATQPAVRR